MEKRHPGNRQERLPRVPNFDAEERRQLHADAKADPSVLFERGVALNRAARLFHDAGKQARQR